MKEEVILKSIRHRSVCLNGRYKGPWRISKVKAYEDGSKHVAKREFKNHICEVETRQEFRSRKI